MNQGTFAKVIVDADDPATAEPTGAFAWLLDTAFHAEVKAHTSNAADPEDRRRWNFVAPLITSLSNTVIGSSLERLAHLVCLE